MADSGQVELLKHGVGRWNDWRETNEDVTPDFSGADLTGADLREANLYEANLDGASLSGALLSGANLNQSRLIGANLRNGDLNGASLCDADLRVADLRGADFCSANLSGADFRMASLSGADLSGADLSGASLVDAILEDVTLTGAVVFGVSVWRTLGEPRAEKDLVITAPDEPAVTVDSLKVAQFIYLLLHNEEIRGVIDTVTSKVVLILGRFTEERKAVLDALRNELRGRNYAPVVVDFDIPADRDITETVTLLARMARFVIADLTDPRSIPQELQAIAPDVAVPIQPVVLVGQEPWSMFADMRRKYHWVLEPYEYANQEALLGALGDVIRPAEAKRAELSAPAAET